MVSALAGKTPAYPTDSFIFDQALGLASYGVNVHLIHRVYEPDSTSYGISFHGLSNPYSPRLIPFAVANARVVPLRSIMMGSRRIAYLYRFAFKVRQVVETCHADLIHAHFAYPEGFVGLVAKNSTKKPLVVSVHGYDVNTVPEIGYGARLDKRIDRLVSKVLRSADAVVCVSHDLQKKVLEVTEEPEKLQVIPIGVDLDRFNPGVDSDEVRNSFGSPRVLVLALRHLLPVYGLEYLIRAARVVADSEPKVLFVIGGDGPLREPLESLIRNLGLVDNVKLVGNVPREMAPAYVSACDIAVIPSLSEGISQYGQEAAAAGKPIIATQIGGLPEVVHDGINGYLVPPKNPESLAEKMLALIGDEGSRRRMGEESYNIARKEFDFRRNLTKIQSVYESLVVS